MTFRDFLYENKWAMKLWKLGAELVSRIKWPRTQAVINGGVYYSLTESDHDILRKMLSKHYLIILTRRRCALSSHIVSIMSWLKTREPSHYTHSLMNTEGDVQGTNFKLIEATRKGVHYSTFMEVFDCDSFALLKPRGVTFEEWTGVLDAVNAKHGAKYDDLFDLTRGEDVSCVELIYQGIQMLPEWDVKFADLVELIKRNDGELTPQMFYDCGDLELVIERRR